MTNNPILAKLKELSDGLLYMSETDAPFEVFEWESAPSDLAPEAIVGELLTLPAHADILTQDFDDFFARATQMETWFDDVEKELTFRFQTLVAYIKDNLTHLQVLRVGSKEIEVFILGKTTAGNWAGLKTFVVET